MRNISSYGIEVGALPIDKYDRDFAACSTSFPSESCYVNTGSACAYLVFQTYGWNRWKNSAKACGCLTD